MARRRSLLAPLLTVAALVAAAPAVSADAPWSPPASLPAGVPGAAPAGAMTLDGHAGLVVPNDRKVYGATGFPARLLRLDSSGAVVANDGFSVLDPHVTIGDRHQLVIAGSSSGTEFPGTIDATSHIRVATTLGAGGQVTIAPVHGSTGLHVDAVTALPDGTIALVGADTRRRVVYLRTPRQRDFHGILTIKASNIARGATVALGHAGDVLVVWEDGHRIYARHRGARGTWGPRHTLGAGIQSDLQAAIDASGRELVAWKSQRINEGESNSPAIISFATAAPGRGWGARRQIESAGGAPGAGHYVASPGVELDLVDRDSALLTWTGFDGTNYVVRAMDVEQGHRGPVQTLSPAGTDAILGDATVAYGDGPALVLWRSGVRGADPTSGDVNPRLFASTRAAGAATFGAPEPISAPGAYAYQPPIAMLASVSGTALAAFGVADSQAQVSARTAIAP